MWRHGVRVTGLEDVTGWRVTGSQVGDSERRYLIAGWGDADLEVAGWKIRDSVADLEVTGWQVGDSEIFACCERVSGCRETPPPGVLMQGCDFMGVIFRRNVRM